MYGQTYWGVIHLPSARSGTEIVRLIRAAVNAKVGGSSLGVTRGLVLFPEEGRWLKLLDPFSTPPVCSHRVCALGIIWEVCPLFCDPVLDKTTLIIPIHFLGLWSQELMYALGSLCKYFPAKAWQDRSHISSSPLPSQDSEVVCSKA